VRDPAAGVFSAETMLRNMGVPLPWSLMDPLQQGTDANGHSKDPRFQVRGGSGGTQLCSAAAAAPRGQLCLVAKPVRPMSQRMSSS
jgi:hypothetical protein